ncbi:hypothetical protein ACFL57_02210, partial [Candidatus Margulisiibacteriota bacterium]
MNSKSIKPISYITSILLIIFFIALRWNSVNLPYIRDEGSSAYPAWLMSQGLSPYVHAFVHKFPMIIYTYVFAHWINPIATWPPRVLAYIFTGAATILIGLIGAKEFGKKAGWAAMWIMTPMIFLPGFSEYTVKPMKFAMLPLIGILYLYTTKQETISSRRSFIAGCFAAIAIMYKPNVLPFILFIVVFLLYDMWKQSRALHVIGKTILWGMAGILLSIAVIMSYFIVHNSLSAFWECAVVFNWHYANMMGSGSNAWNMTFNLMKSWWFLFALIMYLIYRSNNKKKIFYGGLLISSFLSSGLSQGTNYYLLTIPIIALLSAGGLNQLMQDISNKVKLIPQWLIYGSIICLIMFGLVWPIRSWIVMSPLHF